MHIILKCLLNHGITHHLGLIQTLGNTRDLQFLLHTNIFLACHKISGINHHKDGGHKISNNLHYFLLLLLKTTLLQTSVPPKKPQLPTQPAPNPNNKQVQPVYNNDTTYQTYSVELQEINLRSGKILQQQPKLIENEESEKENITLPQPQAPPYPEILQERKTYTSEEK
jgi:hypothetical protein